MRAYQIETLEHLVLHDVSWEEYERMLKAFGERRTWHSYNEGWLEIASRRKKHERVKKILARLIQTTALELDVEIQGIGSTTLRCQAKEKGIEPDECFYIAHEAEVRHQEDYVPDRDPPPDLAIEVEITTPMVVRLPIYAWLEVPEVWQAKGNKLTMFRLSAPGKYEEITNSLAFPMLSDQTIESFLRRRFEVSENQLVREFIEWLRKEVKGE